LRRLFTKLVLSSTVLAVLVGIGHAGPPSSSTRRHSAGSKSVSHRTSKRYRRTRKGAWKRHGQQQIDTARARQIQEALIREKYLDGEPTGQWDARTQAAMARYQAENGWQNKVTPDSRALIKLGLGPNHQSDLQRPEVKPVAANTSATATTSTKRQ
jgi:peptidoglycan hydrolase-like protein with peptidoglycan-binding domain